MFLYSYISIKRKASQIQISIWSIFHIFRNIYYFIFTEYPENNSLPSKFPCRIISPSFNYFFFHFFSHNPVMIYNDGVIFPFSQQFGIIFLALDQMAKLGAQSILISYYELAPVILQLCVIRNDSSYGISPLYIPM